MLQIVKDTISNLPDISFEELYQNYIMEMSTATLDAELNYVRRHSYDILQIDSILIDYLDRLVKSW